MTPVIKPELPPKKASPKKNTQPKIKIIKTDPPKKNSEMNKSKFKVIKTYPKKKTPTTKTSYYTTVPTSYPSQLGDIMSSTIPTSTSIHETATGMPESTVNVTYISNNTTKTDEPPLWFHDALATTPSTSEDISLTTSVHLEEVSIPSGTMPYGDVTSSGEVTGTSGAILSGDDITVSYSNGGVISDTMVLDDGLTVIIPTITSEDMTDLVSSPWLDLSEYIPAGTTVSATTLDPPTRPPSTTFSKKREEAAITTIIVSTLNRQQKPEENSENNSIDVEYHRIIGVDNDISQNNLIPKRRVNLRERTKNKRIQELLEEKRNFLLRMKRGHAAR